MNNLSAQSNSHINPEWEERLIDFAFGAMDPAEAAEFERGLDECNAHVMLARQYMATLGTLGASVAPAEPPKGHKARFMAKLAATPQESAQTRSAASTSTDERLKVLKSESAPSLARDKSRDIMLADAQEERIVDLMQARSRRQGSVLAPAMAIAAALALLLMGVWLWTTNSALTDQQNRRIEAERQLNTEQALRLAAEQRLTDFAATLNVPQGYTAFPMQAQPGYNATAAVLYNPDTRDASLLADRLDPLPADKVYELWFLPADANAPPEPAGTFTSGENGAAQHSAVARANVGNYAGFAVTVEDSPGTSSPQGPQVLAGKFR